MMTGRDTAVLGLSLHPDFLFHSSALPHLIAARPASPQESKHHARSLDPALGIEGRQRAFARLRYGCFWGSSVFAGVFFSTITGGEETASVLLWPSPRPVR